AVGFEALENNDSSGNGAAGANTAVGSMALGGNIDGAANTAVGSGAANSATNGGNTVMGAGAGASGGGGGGPGITTGPGNTVVGAGAGQHIGAGGENIYIGDRVNPGISESNTIRIGDSFLPILGSTSTCFIGGIFSKVVTFSTPVFINASGQLGTVPSSARYKKVIESMGKSSEAIYSLKPVAFRYKGDETNTPQWGLIAEEVAKVNPDLILLDKEGKPLTVRYEQINAMLLNEFLKEHKKVEEQQSKIENQEATIAQLKSTLVQQQTSFESKVAEQDKRIEALTSCL